MSKLSRSVIVLAVTSLITGATPPRAEEWVAGTKATVQLLNLAGAPLVDVTAGQPFTIQVSLTGSATTRPFDAVEGLSGWLRKKRPNNVKCLEAARMFRATGRLPTDAIDLNGVVIADVTTDDSVHFSDPRLDLATSNMLAAHKLNASPGGIIVHPVLRSLLVSLPARHEIWEYPAASHDGRLLARDLAAPGAMVAGVESELYVSEDGIGAVTRISAEGEKLSSADVGDGPIRLSSSENYVAAVAGDGRLAVLHKASGALVFSLPANSRTVSAAIWEGLGSTILVTVDERHDGVSLRFLDAPDTVTFIRAATDVQSAAISPDGRFAIAYGNQSKGVSLISLASGQLVQGLALPSPAAEVVFVGQTALLRLADSSAVYSIDLNSAGPGLSASVGRTPLGPAVKEGGDGPGLLFTLDPTPQAVAVHPGMFSAIVIQSNMTATDTLPNTGFRLKGGVPVFVGAIDRSFRKTLAGIYKTSSVVPSAGRYELVLSTGVSGMTACFEVLAVGTGQEDPPPRLVKLVAKTLVKPSPGESTAFVFTIEDENDLPESADVSGLRVLSLQMGWRMDFPATPMGDGFAADLILPFPGLYAVQPIGLPDTLNLVRSTEIEVVQ